MVFIPSRKALATRSQSFERFYEQIQRSLTDAQRKSAKPKVQQSSNPPSPMGPPRWLSIALPLPDVDPLHAMQQLGGFDQQHFYWEQPSAGLAVAAADPCTSVQFHGPARFHRSQTFLRNCIAATVVAAPLDLERLTPSKACDAGTSHADTRSKATTDLPFTGPRFYCSFTFFDTVASAGKFPPATLFLPRWQVARQTRGDESRCSFVAHVTLQRGGPDRDDCLRIWHHYQTLRQLALQPTPTKSSPGQPKSSPGKPPAASKTHGPNSTPSPQAVPQRQAQNFQRAVQSVLDTIAEGDLHKAVLAHPLSVRAEKPISAFTALNSLRQQHRDCHIFSVGGSLQERCCPIFLGASPERLLRVQARHLQTEAIAGSAPRGQTPEEDQAIASKLLTNQKEQHEHRLVSRFIVEALAKLGLDPERKENPQVLKLAGIQHLQTPITCELPGHLHPLEVLAKLHPTPAVAGVPQELACEQIQKLEDFERSLYASPIGWIDAQGNCDFCVGIRSALIEGHEAQLFAGAGIVSGSQPQQELAEVALKLHTLLAVLTGESKA